MSANDRARASPPLDITLEELNHMRDNVAINWQYVAPAVVRAYGIDWRKDVQPSLPESASINERAAALVNHVRFTLKVSMQELKRLVEATYEFNRLTLRERKQLRTEFPPMFHPMREHKMDEYDSQPLETLPERGMNALAYMWRHGADLRDACELYFHVDYDYATAHMSLRTASEHEWNCAVLYGPLYHTAFREHRIAMYSLNVGGRWEFHEVLAALYRPTPRTVETIEPEKMEAMVEWATRNNNDGRCVAMILNVCPDLITFYVPRHHLDDDGERMRITIEWLLAQGHTRAAILRAIAKRTDDLCEMPEQCTFNGTVISRMANHLVLEELGL